ncbi:hypothetical protein MTO96_048387 [Rhipicephalus appendiculatus]
MVCFLPRAASLPGETGEPCNNEQAAAGSSLLGTRFEAAEQEERRGKWNVEEIGDGVVSTRTRLYCLLSSRASRCALRDPAAAPAGCPTQRGEQLPVNTSAHARRAASATQIKGGDKRESWFRSRQQTRPG